MKTIIGVDGRAGDEHLVRFLRRLRFAGESGAGCSADVVNVVESIPFVWMSTPELSSPVLMEQLLEQQEETGLVAANRTAEKLATTMTGCRSMVRHGSPTDQLLAHAEDSNADLIVVGGVQQGEFTAFLTGSVGRGLVIAAQQSLLIVKGDIAPEGPIRAIFATDHSRYADRCLETLLRFAPQGIEHLTVLTAYPKETIYSLRPLLPEFILDPAEWVKKNLHERNEQVIEKLKPLGCTFDSLVLDDHPNPAIARTMQEHDADLLILGARGHNLVERLTLGSVSFHQVLAEPYPVLVLRAPEEQG
ncbi:MAG: universal stress protein [Armatimonadaceae bacterium]